MRLNVLKLAAEPGAAPCTGAIDSESTKRHVFCVFFIYYRSDHCSLHQRHRYRALKHKQDLVERGLKQGKAAVK